MAETKPKKQSRISAALSSLSGSVLVSDVTNFLHQVSTTGWATAVTTLDPVTAGAVIATTTIFGISHTCEGEADRRKAADLANEFKKLRTQQGNAQYLLQQIANGEIGVTLDWFTQQDLTERISATLSGQLDEKFASVVESVNAVFESIKPRVAELCDKLDKVAHEQVNATGIGSTAVGGNMTIQAENVIFGSPNLATQNITHAPSNQNERTHPATPLFMVPHHRNQHFTGRSSYLSDLRNRLQAGGKAALGQAIHGLGGIGKTQTAVEYAYIHRHNYNAILWVKADTEADVTESYIEIADQLSLPYDNSRPADAIRAVILWLEQNENWLLIFDNADHPDLLKPYLPKFNTGHILLTSRAQLFDMLGIPDPLNLPKLPATEAVEFLLDRTGRKVCNEQERAAAEELAEELDGLPLALEQAGAYILAVKVSFKDYVDCFRRHKLQWLEKKRPSMGDYPDTVATTWNVSIAEVEQESQASVDLLRLSAFLSPDDIPFELITEGASKLSPPLSQALANSEESTPMLQEILEVLGRFSLVDIDTDQKTYSVHRLVQEVVKDAMGPDSRKTWADRSLLMTNKAFPYGEFRDWLTCRRLLPHTLVVAQAITDYELLFAESGRLLNHAAFFLNDQARYSEAEPLYKQAMEIARTALGEDHPIFATTLNNLAGLYYSMGRYSEAEPLHKQALEIRRTAVGEDHPDFATSLNNLALLYHATGRSPEAEPLYKQGMEITRTALGEDHPIFATTLNNLAGLYYSMGRYSDAKPLYKQAIEIRRTALGEDHPDFATSLNNLAGLYDSMGRYSEAEQLYKQAIKIWLSALGEDHPYFTAALNNLTALYRATGQDAKARELEQKYKSRPD